MSGPVSPPLATTESGTSTIVRPTNTLEFNGADFTVTGSGSKATISIDSTGTGAALTDTHIGFGDSSNLLTGSANFTFTEESGGTGPTMLLTGDKPQITIQDDTDATDYKTKLIQSGASLYHYSADSTGTNNEMVRYAQNYIALQRSTTANVGIGTVPESNVEFHVKGTGTGTLVRLESTDAGSTLAPNLQFFRNSGSPAVNDQIGSIQFTANDDGGAQSDIGRIYCYIEDETATTENGVIILQVAEAGSLRNNIVIGSTLVSVNGSSRNVDFRILSDDSSVNFYSDAGQNNVGIGGTPDSGTRLHVQGDGSKASTVRIQTDDDDAAVGPVVELFKNSASPDTGDDIGQILFTANDSAGAKQNYFQIKGEIRDKTSGSDDGELIFIGPSNSTDIEFMRMSKTVGVVVNEGGGGIVDFRVEGTSDANLISTDAADDSVGIGSVPDTNTAKLQVTDDGTKSYTILMESTDPDANAGPTFGMWRNSGSPAAGDDIGTIYFAGENDAGSRQNFAQIDAEMDDVTSGGEDASINFRIQKASNLRKAFRIRYSEVVVNEDSDDIDFRVESNGQTHMLQVDSGNNLVSVGAQATTGLATFQVKDNTIAHYCNVNTIRSDAVGVMTMVNEDCQGQMWVHDSASAHEIDLPEGGVKGMHFQFMSTDGNITIDPLGSDTLNGGTASLTRSTNYEIYDVFCYDTGKWALSNPA